ncbi:hypothetical protein N9Q19_01685 [Puniceicoccaceae bacterium]|nr:hypothetical protein [Puniceicoccaceae bacterium]
MNIKPSFRTSIEWKKYKRSLNHPAAMEFLVNLGCELEGITGAKNRDTGHLGTNDLEDLVLMAGADQYEGIEAARLGDSLLSSGLMIEDEDGYRLVMWEDHNANLISNRQNGRKGGRKKNSTKANSIQNKGINITEGNNIEDNENGTELKWKRTKTEDNLTEHNLTRGLTQEEPTVNRGLSVDEVSKKLLENEVEGHYVWED